MYICIYVYVYIYIFKYVICINIHLYLYIYMYMYTCVYVYLFTCVYVYLYTCVHIYIYICVKGMQVGVHVYITCTYPADFLAQDTNSRGKVYACFAAIEARVTIAAHAAQSIRDQISIIRNRGQTVRRLSAVSLRTLPSGGTGARAA